MAAWTGRWTAAVPCLAAVSLRARGAPQQRASVAAAARGPRLKLLQHTMVFGSDIAVVARARKGRNVIVQS